VEGLEGSPLTFGGLAKPEFASCRSVLCLKMSCRFYHLLPPF
jgi:hypothetical protein